MSVIGMKFPSEVFDEMSDGIPDVSDHRILRRLQRVRHKAGLYWRISHGTTNHGATPEHRTGNPATAAQIISFQYQGRAARPVRRAAGRHLPLAGNENPLWLGCHHRTGARTRGPY